MPDTYVIKDQFAPYFLTFQVVAWVDVFTRQAYRDIVVDSFNFCVEKQHLHVHAWVIMSNHVHCILSSGDGALSNTIGNLKKHCSKMILKTAQEERCYDTAMSRGRDIVEGKIWGRWIWGCKIWDSSLKKWS